MSALGAAWGCHRCGAPGPMLNSPCPICQAEIPLVMLGGRQTGVHLYNESLHAAEAGFYSEATELLEIGIDLAGKDAETLALLGLLYYQSGRVAEANAAWQQAGPTGSGGHLAQAAASYRSAATDAEALQIYNSALQSAAQGRWPDAVQTLSRLWDLPVRLAPAFVLLGLCHWAMDQHDDAGRAWRRAIELDPSTPGLQVCLAALVTELARPPEHPAALPVAAVAPAPQAAPNQVNQSALPSGPARSAAWVPALVAILIAASVAGVAYRSRGLERARADAAVFAREKAEEANAQVTQELGAANEAARAARADAASSAATASQAAARAASALDLLTAAAPSQRVDGLERLLAAIDQARQSGLIVPDWLVQTTDANRVAAAIDRYFEGYRAFMADEYVQAISLFDASLALSGAVYCSDDAAYLAARSAQILGRHAEAVTWYARVIADFPRSNYQSHGRYFGAIAAAQAGDQAQAITWYRELLSSFPGSGYDWEATQALTRLES